MCLCPQGCVTRLVDGLCCKALNFLLKHKLIVSRILGTEHALIFTKLTGIAVILMVPGILRLPIFARSATCSAIKLLQALTVVQLQHMDPATLQKRILSR